MRNAVLLAAALLLSPPAGDAATRPRPEMLQPPVRPACVSSPFGPRRQIGPQAPAAFHRGIDLPAMAGAPVFAVAAGQVVGIHRRGPGGLEVVIRHDHFTALYAHLGSVAPALAEGKSRVAAGERIGVVGRTGVTYGTHLYFEVLIDGQPINPQPLLGLQCCETDSSFCPAASPR
jgi:murein DD-endopeptidase MepM/ murein hydrolase activator NlpD